MMANRVLWCFFWFNVTGFFIMRRWYKKKGKEAGLNLNDMGISFERGRPAVGGMKTAKTILLAAVLAGFACVCEHLIETIFMVDYRFMFLLQGRFPLSVREACLYPSCSTSSISLVC